MSIIRISKRLLLALGLLLCVHPLQAQYNLSTLYGLPNNIANQGTAPSMIRLYEGKTVQVGFLNMNFFAHNGNINPQALSDFLENGDGTTLSYDDPRKQQFLDGIDDFVRLGAGLRFQPLSIAVQLPQAPNHTFTLSAQERLGFHLGFSSDFAEFALYGNKRFQGRNLSLAGDLELDVYHSREYALGYAVNLPANWLGLDAEKGGALRAGARLKLLTSAGGLHLEGAGANVFTHPGGDSLSLSLNGTMYQAGFNEDFSPMQTVGMGFGADLSLTATINPQFEITAGVLDIGSLRFNKGVERYTINEQRVFSGFQVGLNYFDNRAEIETDAEQLEVNVDTISGGSFSIGLPTRSLLHATLGLSENEDARNVTYYRHMLMLTYIQGFRPVPQGSIRPLIAMGYRYSVGNRFQLGTNITAISPANFTMGMFLALTTPMFNMSIGSDNLFHSLTGNFMRGADFAFNTSFTF